METNKQKIERLKKEISAVTNEAKELEEIRMLEMQLEKKKPNRVLKFVDSAERAFKKLGL